MAGGAPIIDPAAARYLSFEGGGGSGMAYVGALQAFATARFGPGRPGKDFTWDLDGVAGSSVGAITALMVALDYTPDQLADLIVRDGIFSALFAEQVQPGHFGAAATPAPGAAAAPMVGYFSKSFEGRRHPADRGPALKAHCCPGAAEPAAGAAPGRAGAGEEGAGGGLIGTILDTGTQPAFGALLRLAIGPYARALLSASFATAKDANAKSGPQLLDSFTDHMHIALAAALPDFLAAVAERRGGDLGVLAGYLSLLRDDLEALARDSSSEVKAVSLLAQPAALMVLLLVVLLGRNLQGDREDVLKFEEGRKPSRRRERKLVGANNVQYYLGCLWTILLHQTGFPDRSNPDAIRDFKRQTIGSPAFMLPLVRGLTAESPEDRKAAWQSFGRYCSGLIGRYFGPRFALLFKALGQDGGLWHGDAMRDILAFVVFNKVEVAGPRGFGTRDQLKFAMREQPLTTILGEEDKEFATADLFDLARQPSRREHKEEQLKKGKGGLAALAAAKLHPARTRLARLAAKLAKLAPSPKLIAALGGTPTYRLSAHQQFRAIRDWFDFALFRETTGRDLVVTGTNITSSQPVFFRESLTPDFPVTEAVRISAGFPIVFKPTAVAYVPSGKDGRMGRRRGDAAQVKRFYETHYCGYFIDGGFLNNHPMQAFSGVQAGADGDNTPQEMLAAAFGDKVLGFHLTNNEPETCPFGGTFEETKGTRGFGAVLSGMMGTFYASGSTLRFLDPKIEEHTIALRFGNLDLLDLKPDYFAVIDVQGANYEAVLKRFGQAPAEGAGAKAMDEMYGINAVTGGDSGRDAQRKWRRAYRERATLMKALAQWARAQ